MSGGKERTDRCGAGGTRRVGVRRGVLGLGGLLNGKMARGKNLAGWW